MLARAGDRRGDRQRQDRGAVLEARVRGLRQIQGMDGAGQARRGHRRLQRSCFRLLGRADPDLRARLRRRIPACRRGLGTAAGAGGQGPSAARLPYRAVGHSRRVRSHHRQQDGGRSRPHRAAQPDVRVSEGMAVPGDPSRGQRGDVSAADRAPLLHAGAGDPQGGAVLPGGFAGPGARHRRHVPPDFRAAGRPDQHQVRHRVPRQSHQGPAASSPACRMWNTCARRAPRASRW